MGATAAQIYEQVQTEAIYLEETYPEWGFGKKVSQIVRDTLLLDPTINRVNLRALAIAAVGSASARPQSIIATAAADPVGSFVEGIGLLDGWQKLVFQIAVGAVGVILILFGIMLIAGEATLNSAASKFGKSIGAGIKGNRK